MSLKHELLMHRIDCIPMTQAILIYFLDFIGHGRCQRPEMFVEIEPVSHLMEMNAVKTRSASFNNQFHKEGGDHLIAGTKLKILRYIQNVF